MSPFFKSASSQLDGLAKGMLNALPYPTVLIDRDDLIVWTNPAGEQFFQSSLKQVRSQPISQLVPYGSPLIPLIERVRETGASVTEYKIDLGTPRTGSDKPVDVYASGSVDLPGGVFLVLHPRGMAERIEHQLVSRGSARSVVGLAAMLAHEIKNPLSGIRGAAQLLEQSVSPDDRALTYLIRDETDRIVHLVERMEVFGDERPMAVADVNLHAVLGRVKALAKAGFASKVTLHERYDPSIPMVQGNEDRLIQIFLNLIKNASEALERSPNPEITLATAFRPGIRLKAPGTSGMVSMPLQVTVSDNGPGIDPDLQPHLFDAFVTTKESGSGLGLALVAKYVADHGGIVDVQSGGDGTVVKVLLPWTPVGNSQAKAFANAKGAARDEPKRPDTMEEPSEGARK